MSIWVLQILFIGAVRKQCLQNSNWRWDTNPEADDEGIDIPGTVDLGVAQRERIQHGDVSSQRLCLNDIYYALSTSIMMDEDVCPNGQGA